MQIFKKRKSKAFKFWLALIVEKLTNNEKTKEKVISALKIQRQSYLTKRSFRHLILEYKLPLTRLECHFLYCLIQEEDKVYI
jgi:hypothetical protein